MRRLTDAEAAAMLAGQDGGAPPASEDAMAGGRDMLHMSQMDNVGYVSADVLESAGSILGAQRPNAMLAQEMIVYLSLGEGEVQVGDRFTVVHAHEEVRDPETGREIGVLVDRLGWIEVTRVQGESAEAVVKVSHFEMKRGDRLIPRIDPIYDVPVRASTPPVEGQIAHFPEMRSISAHFDVVFLNRGRDHGLEVGSPLEVYRSNGEAEDEETEVRKALPDTVVAQLVVISAEPTTAVAFVRHTHEQLEAGDAFRAPTH
jgi:hypothetical protein